MKNKGLPFLLCACAALACAFPAALQEKGCDFTEQEEYWMRTWSGGADIYRLAPLVGGDSEAGGTGNGAALVRAAAKGDAQSVRNFLARGLILTPRTTKAYAALMAAAYAGKAEVVRLLLGAGADPYAEAKFDATVPLELASRYGYAECVRALLEAGADPNHVSRQRSCTAIMWAAAGDHEECVALLLKAGANPDIKDSNGDAAADWAVSNNSLKSLLSFLMRGPTLT